MCAKYSLADGATVEDVDGTRVILGANGDAAVLNAVASEALDAVLGGGVADAVSAFVGRYDVDEATARRDVEGVVGELVSRGLLVGAA